MSDRELILDTANAVLANACPPHVVRAAERSWLPDLWGTLSGLGFTRLGVPEHVNGPGGDFADAVALVRSAGRHAAPIPLAETLLAAQIGAAAELALPGGPLTASAAGALRVERRGAGVRVEGCLPLIPWAGVAEQLVVVADTASAVVVIDLADCDIVPAANMAGEPHADVVIALDIGPGHLRELPGDWSEERLVRFGAVFRVAQIAGALDRACELTIKYAAEREQFRRPIGAFQAVQHHIAMLAGISTAADLACEAAASTPDSSVAVASAKAYVSRVCGVAAMIAHQVHGAIGITAEYQLQLFTRRLWSWREEFGNDIYWATRLAGELEAAGASLAWNLLSAT
jgi:acyl-CoA dehydrogenase